EIGMKAGAVTVLQTVHRPLATVITEARMIARMPAARGDDRNAGTHGLVDEPVEHRHDAVTSVDRQRPTGAEVLLYVDDDQRVAGFESGMQGRRVHGAPPCVDS